MSNATALVQELWRHRNILLDDGLSYGDYVEQLAFLLFLKMADEQARPLLVVAEAERRLSMMEDLAAVVDADLQRTFRLRQSILQKAFTGGHV